MPYAQSLPRVSQASDRGLSSDVAPSTMEMKPIPAFYCCYLLRSAVRHASLYVGSTPNPARRLAQHNGQVVGGAVRTSRLSLRPWEMICIVAGFPSNIAALQFEWAWQNAHLTRHIPPEQRISFATTRSRASSKTGRTRTRPGRPRASLVERLSNLHVLLRAPYFSGWPLELRFFHEEGYRAWQTWCERVDAQVDPNIKVRLDLPTCPESEDAATQRDRLGKHRKAESHTGGGLHGVDPTYARFHGVVEKSRFLLDEGDGQMCVVCQKNLHLATDLFTICPHGDCSSLAHIKCLASRFLTETNSTSLVPARGTCPSCQTALRWDDLMREVTLRTRRGWRSGPASQGTRDIRSPSATEIPEFQESRDLDPDSEDELNAADIVDEDGDRDEIDNTSVCSLDSVSSQVSRHSSKPGPQGPLSRMEIVIEDSDDDDDADMALR